MLVLPCFDCSPLTHILFRFDQAPRLDDVLPAELYRMAFLDHTIEKSEAAKNKNDSIQRTVNREPPAQTSFRKDSSQKG
jgi:hypothetical protein